MLARVRAEDAAELAVLALAEQVEVELAERRQERVRVVDRFGRAGVASSWYGRGHAWALGHYELEQAAPVDAPHRLQVPVDHDRRHATGGS